ncbi:MAG: hypothetical protein WCJ84_04375 [Candidatus Peregrinibacteria bacterium]
MTETFYQNFAHKFRIGVMGSAQGPDIVRQENTKLAIRIGEAIATTGNILVNGACPGLPNDSAIGAKHAGGFVMGVSPAFSRREHLDKYNSPIDPYDMILYTGMGLMQRDILNIRFSDAVIILGGGIGTLNEFTVAFDEGRYIGVLTSADGISSHVKEVIAMCHREEGDRIFFSENPEELVKTLVEAMETGPQVTTEDERIVSKYTFLK